MLQDQRSTSRWEPAGRGIGRMDVGLNHRSATRVVSVLRSAEGYRAKVYGNRGKVGVLERLRSEERSYEAEEEELRNSPA